ncbi:propionyl-CoA carboxylase precursor, biotin carrier protein [Syncephalastrum racemosum]|uniref:Propionyl-CoA carboxylase, biotin carrier protein n=1 Tax=Syncephalastrum racemosum TaxID=13706 RepID=A0A1X2H4T4_SYNRA|nr:propionyl-CoA carboxylase precursor, biotin carrier protein [Syncephalastrum racemosum]
MLTSLSRLAKSTPRRLALTTVNVTGGTTTRHFLTTARHIPALNSVPARRPFVPYCCFCRCRSMHTPATPLAKKTFDKILVANRGEIACRVIATARKLNIRTVAVYTDQDAQARHVREADESVLVPSYLAIDAMVTAALATGSQAVHPGYGFLSENPHFVDALDKAGVVFVGPNTQAIAAMGDKIASKKLAIASRVSCIPGFDGEVTTFDHAREVAHQIGYPVMVKASAGGGGKGMRIAWNDDELREGFKLAKHESLNAFGDDRLLVEKYIDRPRHIEIQVLGDAHGHVVYLPERDCSIQRRNQKVIEESPSVHIDDATRRAMGEQAVALAKHVNYNSAGTVEFLVDAQRNFYFLEMNTRLQVEHPITELVTGLDLVEHMLYSAAGHPLALDQAAVARPRGWAIEARVYAEDPVQYLPSAGRLTVYQEPPVSTQGTVVRCDSGVAEGSEVPVDYDPLLCKLVTHADTRKQAVDAMVQSLDRYVIQGVTHNVPLLRSILAHPRFVSGGEITTHFLAQEMPSGYQAAIPPAEDRRRLAIMVAAMASKTERAKYGTHPFSEKKIWVQIKDEQTQQVIEDTCINPPHDISLQWPLQSLLAHATVEGHDLTLQYLDKYAMSYRIQFQGNTYTVTLLNEEQRRLSQYMRHRPKEVEFQHVLSPMTGRIISVAVKPGDKVTQGSEIAVVEAMKMQNVLRAARAGTVQKVKVGQGALVTKDQVLVEF